MTMTRTTWRFLRAAAFGAALLSSACTSDNGGVGATTEAVYGLVTDGIFGSGEKAAAPAKIERKMAADLPYASIGVTIDDNPQFLFLLANQTPDSDLYTLGYQVSLVLRGGRVIRSQGLMQDVLGGRWEGEDIIKTAARTNAPVAGTRWFELATRGIATHEAHCTATGLAFETVMILETPILARKVVEDCSVPSLKWKFTNQFWIVPDTGQVWLSLQHTGPKVSPLVIETFRPAGPAPSAAPAG